MRQVEYRKEWRRFLVKGKKSREKNNTDLLL